MRRKAVHNVAIHCLLALGWLGFAQWCLCGGSVARRKRDYFVARPRRHLVSAEPARASWDTGMRRERSQAFLDAVEAYFPGHPEDGLFDSSSPLQGFRNLTESIRPYHPNPEWMIWPEEGSFERDQKVASLYTLATGLYKTLNRCIREDNEDGMRRHAGFIWELRQLLRFKRSTICTPEGRMCRPFQGRLLRGLEVESGSQLEQLADAYRVGTEFAWPGFAACQLEEAGLWPFDGNLNFEIHCNIDPRDMAVEELYAPVRIGRFLQDSSEVILPPYTQLRVVDAWGPEVVRENGRKKEVFTRVLEVVGLPEVMSPQGA
mmetsp:Transcript_31379/g.73211  ORF Transcript_31379/g.73211 Transcript_31379/m.73211 type:complete len:318 (-) Transcript_31379:11-964(-)